MHFILSWLLMNDYDACIQVNKDKEEKEEEETKEIDQEDMEILDSTLHMSTVDLPVKEEKETMNETDPVSSSMPVVQGDSEMNETKEEPLKEEKNDDEPTQDHQSESGHPSPHSEEESQKEEEVKEKAVL